MNNYKPYIAAFSYSFFVGLSFLITKLVVPHAAADLILAHRFAIAFISYSLFLIITKTNLNICKKTMVAIIPVALFYPLLFFSLQVYGLQHSSSSEAGIIFATVPIMTVILATLMGNKPSFMQIVSVTMSVSGVVLIFLSNLSASNGTPLGIVLLFLSALSFSFYTILVKRILNEIAIHELTFLIISIGFIVFNSMFVLNQGISNSLILTYIRPFKTINYTFGIFYLGFLASVAASYFSNYALQYLSPPQFSVFSNLSTLISIVAGALILREPLTLRHFYGIALILIGVVGTNFSSSIETRLSLAFKKS